MELEKNTGSCFLCRLLGFWIHTFSIANYACESITFEDELRKQHTFDLTIELGGKGECWKSHGMGKEILVTRFIGRYFVPFWKSTRIQSNTRQNFQNLLDFLFYGITALVSKRHHRSNGKFYQLVKWTSHLKKQNLVN